MLCPLITSIHLVVTETKQVEISERLKRKGSKKRQTQRRWVFPTLSRMNPGTHCCKVEEDQLGNTDCCDDLKMHICKFVENLAYRFDKGFTDPMRSIHGLQAEHSCLTGRPSRIWLLVKDLTTWFYICIQFFWHKIIGYNNTKIQKIHKTWKRQVRSLMVLLARDDQYNIFACTLCSLLHLTIHCEHLSKSIKVKPHPL